VTRRDAARGLVFDVQRCCVHDGPGIRTVVFFKGCGMRCPWCQNPEGIEPRIELAYDARRCLGAGACRACAPVCARRALTVSDRAVLERDRCDDCGACAAACPAEALRPVGRTWTVDDLVATCLRDRAFFAGSGGGVTLSGGEPVLQDDFLLRLLPRLREAGVHVLLETAGGYAWRRLERLLGGLDAVYFDWKVPIDDYRRTTGVDGATVAGNLRRLLASGVPTRIRMPIIAGVNCHPDALASIAETLLDAGADALTLVPYHPLWEAKLPRLRTRQRVLGPQPPVELQAVADVLAARGLRAVSPQLDAASDAHADRVLAARRARAARRDHVT